MNLFEQAQKNNDMSKPLAYRMRPRRLDRLYGQEDIIGRGKALRKAIEADCLQSIILYGPPGSGKTSLARVIAEKTEANFIRINAVTSGVKDLRNIIEKAENNLHMYEKKTILCIDEIHRFNKSQQDALLPEVEAGTITMIGATTENPYFEVNSPLLSRSQIYRLKVLEKKDILKIIDDALNMEKGLANYNVKINLETKKYIAELSSGDARRALNILELAVLTTPPDNEGNIKLNKKIIAESAQEKQLNYDKTGDKHYDNISAFIKSMRGSDPDAALLYLARMIEAGEDPRFIARRIIVHAAEDVGLADPRALQIAISAAKAVEYVGMPEARIPLAEAVIYIATAPKSNSTIKAIDRALEYVKEKDSGEVPLHLRDSHYQGAKDLEHGSGYKYPHNFSDNYVEQDYLPNEADLTDFYQPGKSGEETTIKKRLNYWRNNTQDESKQK
ncbi:MAG: replication-associated recombination protein A [Halanaerobium sp.]